MHEKNPGVSHCDIAKTLVVIKNIVTPFLSKQTPVVVENKDLYLRLQQKKC